MYKAKGLTEKTTNTKQNNFLQTISKKLTSVKNFTKLLMAVVLLASYSCVQDATEDLAPTLSETGSGSGEVKTLQVALPVPTRTELGNKNEAGKYPVYWCEGDVLSVNGKPTTGVTINQENKSIAVFGMPLDTSIPYHILYPYSGEEVNAGSGMYPVRFAAEQVHTEGTFANGSAPMYAWSNGFEDVEMHHLSTVLRLAITNPGAESVNLRYISVSTVDASPIAGVFDVYCGSSDNNDEKTGTIVAREGANSTVIYNFGKDGDEIKYHPLTNEGSVFYIVVPKGEYKGFVVNFVAQDGAVCERTFSAEGDNKLEGGTVREFSTQFEANSKMFLVGNSDQMLAFAQEVQSGDYSGALLVSDIDMTNVEWTPIEGYNKLFEGRDNTIKGLTVPLFGNDVAATISNVNIESNIVETENGKVGLLARSLVAGGEVFNCSVSGTLNYDNTTLDVEDNLKHINVGGLIGGIYGGKVSLSKSNVNITISNSAKSGESNSYKPCVGGIVGYICQEVGSEDAPVVVNNTSSGDIDWRDASQATQVVPYIGGVAGYVTAGTFTDNVNAGELVVTAPTSVLDWGGVAGVSSVSIARCENKGTMTINEAIDSANIGGVLGQLEAGSIDGCSNSGKLNFNEEFFVADVDGYGGTCNIGGVIALAAEGTDKITNCSNAGTLTYKGSCYCAGPGTDVYERNAQIRIAGVVGLSFSKEISYCENKQNSTLSIAGSIAGSHDTYNNSAVAAVVGTFYAGAEGVMKNCSNLGEVDIAFEYYGGVPIYMSACVGLFSAGTMENCTNGETGKVSIGVSASYNGNSTVTQRAQINVAGLLGYVDYSCTIKNSGNEGKIIYDNAQCDKIHLGGVMSSAKSVDIVLQNCYNNGELEIGENLLCKELYLSGMTTSTTGPKSVTITNCSNQKNIVCGGQVTDIAYIGAIYAYSNDANKSGLATTGVENTGTIKFAKSASTKNLFIGGYTGVYQETNHCVSFVNKGSVECHGTATNAFVGGFAGMGQFAKRTTLTPSYSSQANMSNVGNVYVDGATKVENLYVAGCCGLATTSTSTASAIAPNPKDSGVVSGKCVGSVQKLENSGTVEVALPADAENYPTNIYMGGVAGFACTDSALSTSSSTSENSRIVTDCHNYGKLIYNGIARDGAYVGGVVGQAYKAVLKGCTNGNSVSRSGNGEIMSSGNAGSLIARQAVDTDEQKDAFRLAHLHYHDLAIGGIVGETNTDVVNCVNNGAVTQLCTVNPLKTDSRGDVASSRFDIGGVVGRAYVADNHSSKYTINLSGLENNGKVTIDGDYPYCTVNTPSIDWADAATPQSNDIDDGDRTNTRLFYRMNVAGIVGRLHDHSTKQVDYNIESCVNTGNLETTSKACQLRNFNIAGVVADILVCTATINATNRGNVTLNGVGKPNTTSIAVSQKHGAYFINMGGIAAFCFDQRSRTNWTESKSTVATETITFNACENEGNLQYNETAASIYQRAGGILAEAFHHIGNNWGNKYYSSKKIVFNNCKNGGNIGYIASGLATQITPVNDNFSYAGGIIGNSGHLGGAFANMTTLINKQHSAVDIELNGCENSGNIQFGRFDGVNSFNVNYNTTAVGGLVGVFVGSNGWNNTTVMDNHYYSAKIHNCSNSGRIYNNTGSVGGIIGQGYWFVDIDNAVNTGDIVVVRADNGEVAVRNKYGAKKENHVGGIAGILIEYTESTTYLGKTTQTNEAAPAFPLGTQYARVTNSVNYGAVGGRGKVGGIVGWYRSLRVATDKMYPGEDRHRGGIEKCTNYGDIYCLDGMGTAGAIVGVSRMLTMATATDTSTTEETIHVTSQSWEVGVRNCNIGENVNILRGASVYLPNRKINETMDKVYQNCIYGENWRTDYTSLVSGKYDGCKVVALEE